MARIEIECMEIACMEIVIEVPDVWFASIFRGEKRVEGRRAKAAWGAIRIGMTVRFVAIETRETVRAYVIDVREYNTPRQYFEQEGLRATVPGVQTIDEAERTYLRCEPQREQLARAPVVAIEFALLH